MAYSSLSLNVDKYELFLSNEDEEYQRNPIKQQSSASNFKSIMDPGLDISTLIFLKSSDAEIALSTCFVNNLPLAISQTELISIYVAIPLDSSSGNQSYNITQQDLFNNTPFIIPLTDFTTTEAEDIIGYLNDAICEPTTFFLIKSYLRAILDVDVFEGNVTSINSKREFKLLIRYLEIALFTRHIIHNCLVRKLAPTTIPNSDIRELITFTQTKAEQATMNQRWEQDILNDSRCIKPVASRENVTASESRILNLEQFYGVTLTKVTEPVNPSRVLIERKVDEFLTNVLLIETTLFGVLTEESITTIKDFLSANRKLIFLALKTRHILILNKDRIDKRTNTSRLFADFLVSFTLDNQKLKVEMNPTNFLTDTSVLILFPEQVSYVIGGKAHENVRIGPITAQSTTRNDLPALTQILESPRQRLYARIRPLPRIIHILCDLISTLSRDTWLRNSKHLDFSIIHTMVLTDDMVNMHFISKVDKDEYFYRTSNARKVLNGIRFRMVDDSFRLIQFPVCTIAKLSFVIRPVLNRNL